MADSSPGIKATRFLVAALGAWLVYRCGFNTIAGLLLILGGNFVPGAWLVLSKLPFLTLGILLIRIVIGEGIERGLTVRGGKTGLICSDELSLFWLWFFTIFIGSTGLLMTFHGAFGVRATPADLSALLDDMGPSVKGTLGVFGILVAFMYAWVRTIKFRKYGASFLELESYPIRVGETLKAVLRPSAYIHPRDTYIHLGCTYTAGEVLRDSGMGSPIGRDRTYVDESITVKRADWMRQGTRWVLPFTLDIPGEAPPTSFEQRIKWKLSIETSGGFPQFNTHFDLTVLGKDEKEPERKKFSKGSTAKVYATVAVAALLGWFWETDRTIKFGEPAVRSSRPAR
jgi:succinate dehydrogenase/fumarate reductase cytochrome b subunit